MMELIWQIIQPMFAELVALAIVIGGIFGLIRKGRNDQRRDDELKRAKETAKAHQQRENVEREVDKEPDLIRRAHDAGVVRKPKGKTR